MRFERKRVTGQPGTFFLRAARLVFSEATLDSVLSPAVADFRTEWHEAEGRRLLRFAVRCRWYWSLAILTIVAPRIGAATGDRPLLAAAPNRTGGWFLLLLAMSFYAATWRLFGGFAFASAAIGSMLALALRRWHTRHPPLAAGQGVPLTERTPEINLSSIHVGGDIAGLMFAVGSAAIVIVGLPGLSWFFAAGAVTSVAVAWGRFACLGRGGPIVQNSISPR